jgi:hypothetical protein
MNFGSSNNLSLASSGNLYGRAPQVSHGTRSGSGETLPSALRTGSFNTAASVTNPPNRLSDSYSGRLDDDNDSNSYAKPAMTIQLDSNITVSIQAVPSITAESFRKASFLNNTIDSFENAGASEAAQILALSQVFHGVVSTAGASRAVSDGKKWVRKAVTMTDNFQSGQFVDGFGYRLQGKLPSSPSHRPDNIKYIEAELIILTYSQQPLCRRSQSCSSSTLELLLQIASTSHSRS